MCSLFAKQRNYEDDTAHARVDRMLFWHMAERGAAACDESTVVGGVGGWCVLGDLHYGEQGFEW